MILMAHDMKMRYNASGQISQRESMMLEGRQNSSHSRGQVSRQDYLIILLQGSHPFKPFQRNNACVHTTYMHCRCMFVCANTRRGIVLPFGQLPTELWHYHPEYHKKNSEVIQTPCRFSSSKTSN